MSISTRDRDAVFTALRGGVVPRRGIHLVQVGRAAEVAALVKDIETVVDGGSGIRFVVGAFGAGKSFFLSLVQAVALEKGLVAMSADLNPDRRLQGSSGQARSLYAELTRNMSTRTKPDGGAIASVVERFVSIAVEEARTSTQPVDAVIRTRLAGLSELVNGYDFAEVIACYWRGHDQGIDQLKNDAIRWLRGEFSTRTDARAALGVRSIVDDDAVFDQLKLMARFVRMAGYKGLLIGFDELVNLYKLPNSIARNSNYEQILRVYNDVAQGSADGLQVVFGATPETLLDPRRGLYSYPALQTRLSENRFAETMGLQDVGGPVIRLASLTPEDLYVLLTKLRDLQALGDPARQLLPNEAIVAFLEHCQQKIGASYFTTPRSSIRAFLDVLSLIEQHPGLKWQELLPNVPVDHDTGGDEPTPSTDGSSTPTAPHADDDLTSLRI